LGITAVTADELSAWRKRMGLTQEQAAKALNTPVGTYRGWEQGRFKPPGAVDAACRELESAKK
jgi:DNA-binding transcriptional regulator YiaG